MAGSRIALFQSPKESTPRTRRHGDSDHQPRLQSVPDDYSELRTAGYEAVQRGDLPEAAKLFERAWSSAQTGGDQELIDRAFCNLSMVLIELNHDQVSLGELRRILNRDQNDENCWLAAYHASRIFELGQAFKKALFYARIALERALRMERLDWVASSHNLVGDLLLAESFTDRAAEQYELALDLLGDQVSVRRGQILDNLGYCRILQHRFSDGLERLHSSLELLGRFGANRYLASTHLDLCFAYLEIERYEDAVRHGARALELSQESELGDTIKNTLYLLGQAEWLSGNPEGAREHFRELELCLPGTPGLTELLVSFDLRQLINLRA